MIGTTQNTTKKWLCLLTAGALLLPLLTACGEDSADTTSSAAPHIARADTYADQGQYRSALVEVRNALQAEPGNVSHVVRLAELYLSMGAAREASDLLSPWLEEHPQEVALPLAEAYVRQGKHLSAKETLDHYKPGNPSEQTAASLIQAEVLRTSGDPTEALSLYRSLLANHPSNVDAAVGTLRTLLDLSQPGQATRTAEDWLQQNPASPQIRYWKGMAQYRENHLEAAAQTLTDAAGDLPASDVFLPIRRDILTLLSRVLTEQGKTVEAQVYNRILADNQNRDMLEQGEAAIAALEQDNFEEAKRILGDMLRMDPENRQAALMLGALTHGTGDPEESSRLLTENLDPETTPTPFLRVATMAQIDTGKREQALQTLERAMAARPDDNDIVAMHGILALSLEGHETSGLESLTKAINAEPDRIRLRLALAHHHAAANQPDQAIDQLLEVARRTPDSIGAMQQATRLYARDHSPEETLDWLDRITHQNPELAQNVDTLSALIYTALGDFQTAQERLAPWQKTDSDSVKSAQVELLLAETRAAVLATQYRTARTKAAQAASLAPQNLRVLLLPAAISQAEGQFEQALKEIDTLEERTGKTNPTILARATLLEASEGSGPAYEYLLSQWQENASNLLMPRLLHLARSEGPEAVGKVTSQWIDQHPHNPAANLAHADWLLNSGQGQLAKPHYETVLENNPDNIAALNNLAWILQDTDRERALELSRRAATNAPDNPNALDTYGWLLHLSGQHTESVEVLEKAVGLAPGNEDIAAHLETAKQAL